ncbi:MAG: glycoside hydrolase family 32 protein [Acidimicrobiales bacterium]
MSPIDPFPHLHTRPSHGWVNDPNGIGRWEGRWHVMYQWNPNAPDHGDIHWGHMSSTDLLSWRDEGVALRPRPGTIDAAGVWSGVAVPEGGGAALVYTAVSADASTARVAVARQESDGDWVQPERTATDHPDHGRWFDVRDPFVVLVGGRRLGIMGAGQFDITNGHHGSAETRERTRTGAVLVYDADDLDDWRLLGTLLTAAELPAHMVGSGTFWECPQLVPFGERWLLVVSWDEPVPADERRGESAPERRHGVAAYVGDLDLSGSVPRFVPTAETPLDHGPDFYAPQLVVDDGRILAWGWSWEGRGTGTNHRSAADIAASGWAGTLTFPREVMAGPSGLPVCMPAHELDRLRGGGLQVQEVDGVYEMHTSEPAWMHTATGDVMIDLVNDTTGAVRAAWRGSTSGTVDVFADGSIVEMFTATGSTTLRAYPAAGERWRVRSTGPAQAQVLHLPDEPDLPGG